MKKIDFDSFTLPEIEKKESELRNELMLLRLKRKVGQFEKTHRFSELRKDIARLERLKSSKE